MIVKEVKASKKYKVLIGSDILEQTGQFIEDALVCDSEAECSRKVAVIADSNTGPLYCRTVKTSLEAKGFETHMFTFDAGEKSKNVKTYAEILSFLANRDFVRKDIIVALGGGVTGDMAGFAASTYMRGIEWVQIPTTVMAAVDSSVGGKTAVDLPEGKNLVGSFYQPLTVICDVGTLVTLPERERRNGFAEILKYAMISDVISLEDAVSAYDSGSSEIMQNLIGKCIEIKSDIVERDEFEKGTRRLLNFGHTIGHAVETLSDYTMLHGECVAIGMSVITKASSMIGFCDGECIRKLHKALDSIGLPSTTNMETGELLDVIRRDKKTDAEGINAVLPERIGSCVIQLISLQSMGKLIDIGR